MITCPTLEHLRLTQHLLRREGKSLLPWEGINFLLTFLLSPFVVNWGRPTYKSSVMYSQALMTMWSWHHFSCHQVEWLLANIDIKLSRTVCLWGIPVSPCVYTCIEVHVHMYMHACKGYKTMQMSSLFHCLSFLFSTVPHWTRAHQLARTDGQQLHRSACLRFPTSSARVIDIWSYSWPLEWVLGTPQQALHHLSHRPPHLGLNF